MIPQDALSRQKKPRAVSKDTRHRKAPKERSCDMCKAQFKPTRTGQKVCGTHCAYLFALAKKAAGERKVKQAERKDYRERRQALKKTAELIAEAQQAFNEFIRARDAGLPCICCGKPMEPDRPGGSVDAGHFRSRGSAPHLRFDERNCFAQRKNCNRPGGTTYAAFKAGVIARIGIEETEALESDQAPRHYTRDELIALRKHYKAKTKALKEMK
jgi:hypothetical protein